MSKLIKFHCHCHCHSLTIAALEANNTVLTVYGATAIVLRPFILTIRCVTLHLLSTCGCLYYSL